MRKLHKIFFVVFLFLLLTTGYGLMTANAAVPHLISYQGRLTDSGGAPLNGSYDLTFRIYDAETAGNLLWEEVQSGVLIQKGIFSVLLGSVTNLNLAFDMPYFLEIKVGSEVMSPRQRLTSAAYAIRAESAEKIKASSGDVASGYLDAKTTKSIVVNSNKLELLGDIDTPGNNKMYGTDGNGIKGWYEAGGLYEPGDALVVAADTQRSSGDYSQYKKVKDIKIFKSGIITVKFDLNSSNGGNYRSYGRIYVNGVGVGIERVHNSETYATYSENITITNGDNVQLYIKPSGIGVTAYAKNFRVYVRGMNVVQD